MTTVPADVCLLIADHGIGDHYIVGAFADAVRRHYGVRVWMAGRGDLSFVANLFPAVESYHTWPAGEDGAAKSDWLIKGGATYYAHFPKLELMRAVGYNGFHFLDAYRCRLGLPATAVLSRPKLPAADAIARAGELLQQQGFVPGRTVVCSIEARTTPTDGVDAAFWCRLAAELNRHGLMMAVNAAQSTAVPVGLRPLRIPLAEMRASIQSAGFFCSVRSGLSDLACDLRCPQVVLYPEVKYWSGGLLDGTTFARYGLTKAPHEKVIGAGYGDAQINAVAEYFGARRPKQLGQSESVHNAVNLVFQSS